MTDVPRSPDRDTEPAGVHRVAAAVTGAVRRVPANQLWRQASSLLAAGLRLVLMSAHHDSGVAGGALRVVYLFTAGPPGRFVELQVRVPLERPLVPALAGMSATAAVFEADLTVGHGIVFTDPPLSDPVQTEPDTTTGPYPRRRPRVPHRGGESTGRQPSMLAARIAASTDTPVGHTLAFCLAVENATGQGVAPHTAQARAILLELERLHHHVTDLAMVLHLCGLHTHHARALRLREHLLRLNHQVSGHRLLRGAVLLGGADLRHGIDVVDIYALIRQFSDFADTTLTNPHLRARLTGLAVLSAACARDLGAVGFIARASGVDNDARRTHPLTDVDLNAGTADNQGDALARFRTRVDELRTSAVLIADLCRTTPAGRTVAAPPAAGRYRTARRGLGVVEGWRGAIVCRVELNPESTVTAATVIDPSRLHAPVIGALRGHMNPLDAALVERSLHTLTDGPHL